MNDVTSLAPLGPINLLRMKSRLVMHHLAISPIFKETVECSMQLMSFGADGKIRCW